jgi:hypothetical protein
MSNEIVIELDEETIEALKLEYGELLGVENLVTEIVLNDLKHRAELKSMIEETRLANIATAKLNSLLGQYEQLTRFTIGNLPEQEAPVEVETISVNATESVQIDDSVGTQPNTTVTVGLDTQKSVPTPKVNKDQKVTNQLLDKDAQLDPKVKAAMEEIRKRNKKGSEQAKHRKGGSNIANGGIVASQ